MKDAPLSQKKILITRQKKVRLAVIFGLTATFLFLVLSTINMFIYPGSYHVARIPYVLDRYSFLYNNLSDLGMLRTFVNQPNLLSAILFTTTLNVTGIGFLIFVLNFPQIFENETKSFKNARSGAILGTVSSISFIGVGWTPWDQFLEIHMIFVVIGFLTSIAFNIAFAIAILRDKKYPDWYAYTMLVFAGLVVAYILVVIFGPPYGTIEARIIESLGQKIVTYCLMILIIINAIGLLVVSREKIGFK